MATNQRLSTVFLNDRVVGALPPPADGKPYVVRDSDLSGFFVVRGTRSKTYTVQADQWEFGKRRTIKKAIGRFGEISSREARAEAKRLLGEIGTKRTRANDPGPTLREGWDMYRRAMRKRGRSEGTVRSYRECVEKVLSDWLDTKLADLSNQPHLVAKRHDEITDKNGPVRANHAMQTLRAIYNYAQKTYRMLPSENPTCGVEFNPVKRRDNGMALEDLPAWFKLLDKLPNPVRQEFHLFTLLSGSRPGALVVAEWQHVDVARQALHIPKPKGGAKRAFDIPLSWEMLACLDRAKEAGAMLEPDAARCYIFPSNAPSGHIEEWKEKRKLLSHYASDLRSSYAAIAEQLGVNKLFIKMLLNHATADVTDGYSRNSSLFPELIRQQQIISSAIAGERVTG